MTGIEPFAMKGATSAATTIPKAIPPAIRVVRRLLDDRNDRQATTRILKSAMTVVAQGASQQAGPEVTEIGKVAKGAITVTSTVPAIHTNLIIRALRRTRKPLRRVRRVRDVSPFSAKIEIAQWVQKSAVDSEVIFFADEQRAREVASLFVEKALVNPSPDDAGFSKRLREAWLISAKNASEAAAFADKIRYSRLSLDLAAAAATNLQREVRDLLVDLTIVLKDSTPHSRQERSFSTSSGSSSTELPGILEVLRRELDIRLLLMADERAPTLAVHLEQVSHQLRLRTQGRPTFDPLALRTAMQAAWQLLDSVDSDSSPTLELAALQAVARWLRPPWQPPEVPGPQPK